jgi:serine/threonine protein kinase
MPPSDRSGSRKPQLSPAQVTEALEALLQATDWVEKKRVVEGRRDLLLTDMADWALDALIKQRQCQSDAQAVRDLKEHQALLARCRQDGIRAAFASRLQQAHPQPASPPPPASSPSDVGPHPPDSWIAGRYEIAGRPLMGGMGIVYACFDHKEQRPVALKSFKPELLPNRAARDRFLREGTAWVDLGRHPHIVRCYEVLYPDPEVYLALELVAKELDYPNASLRPWLIPGQPLPPQQALLFALQIARGMRHAADILPGFVHRDLKPENILVGADQIAWPGDELPAAPLNRLRVTDFGLAQLLESAQGQGGQPAAPDAEHALRRTQLTRGVAGTPLYMAPEQWRRDDLTAATDIYALGCILYEMVAGRPAAPGRSLLALRRAHCAGNLRPLPSELPDPVRGLLTRCLALEPRGRYGDWADLSSALGDAFQTVTGQPAPPPQPAAALDHADRVQAGWSYSAIGASYLHIGKPDVAIRYFERALEAGRMDNESHLVSDALNNLGEACRNLANARGAVKHYEQSLEIKRDIGDRHGQASVLINLGSSYAATGQPRRAIEHYERALEIAREIGDRAGEGRTLNNLGIAQKNLGQARRAIRSYEQSLRIKREIGDRRGEGHALGNLGEAYRLRRQPRRAVRYFEQALEIAREIGDRRGEGQILGNMGTACAALGDAQRAIQYCEQSLAIQREIGDGIGVAVSAFNTAHLYLRQGDLSYALDLAEEAAQTFEEIGHTQHARRAKQLASRLRAMGR